MGMGTRLDGPFINFASIREISPEGESETDFIGIASPYNSSVRIGLDTSYTVRPIIAHINRSEVTSRYISIMEST